MSTEKAPAVLPLQLLTAVVAGLPASSITLDVSAASEAEARAWVAALQLTNVEHRGQPYPLTAAEPAFWLALIEARWPRGWAKFTWREPHTAEREAEWVASGNLKHHPRKPKPADEPTAGGSGA